MKAMLCMECFCIFEGPRSSLTCGECKKKAKGWKPIDAVFIGPTRSDRKTVETFTVIKRRVSDSTTHFVFDSKDGRFLECMYTKFPRNED